MSARRTERLLNLVIALLATRQWLTKEQIRQAVPQYGEAATDAAFDRMFERDKDELRDLGVPVLTGSSSAWFEDEHGYRIDREAYALPEISFTPAELAVLGLASRAWQQATLAGAAGRAMVKLKSLGVTTDEAVVGVESRVRTAEPAFGPLYEATRDRAPVRFRYRTGGTGEPAARTVEPWRITNWHGRWYLVGHDRDRGDARVFRLSRIEGRPQTVGPAGSVTPPYDVDARAMVRRVLAGSGAAGGSRTARVRLDAGSGLSLRRRAGADVSPGALHDDSSVVEIDFTDLDDLAEEVAALGTSALVEGPDDLRDAVVERLRRAVTSHASTEVPS